MIVGFAGAGNMAAAMARGWAGAENGPSQMLFCDLDRARAEGLAQEVGGSLRDSLTDVASDSELVVLAVKPAALEDVAAEMGGEAPAILSVIAATTTEAIGRAFPDVPVLRVMPNQAAEVRRGVLCYVPAVNMPGELESRVIALLGELGRAVPVPEEQIDAAMAVMSCAPAYVARFAGALARAGAREGLPEAVSLDLVAHTLAGTAALLSRRSPAEIERSVAPPGGATEAGLEALERGGFAEAVDAAVEASLERFR
jgi:pyrroline-5-carboxylate reductase